MTTKFLLSKYQIKKLICSCNKNEECTLRLREEDVNDSGVAIPILKSDLNKIIKNGSANCTINTSKIGKGLFNTLNSLVQKGVQAYDTGMKVYDEGKKFYNKNKKAIDMGIHQGKEIAKLVKRRKSGKGGWETIISDSADAYNEYAQYADHEKENKLKSTLKTNRQNFRKNKKVVRGKGGLRAGAGGLRAGEGPSKELVSLVGTLQSGKGGEEEVAMEVFNQLGEPANALAQSIARSLGKYRMNKANRLEKRVNNQTQRHNRVLERISTRVANKKKKN